MPFTARLGSVKRFNGFCFTNKCERGDSNPHGLSHEILNLARLPVPPLSPYDREKSHKPKITRVDGASIQWKHMAWELGPGPNERAALPE